MAVEPSCENCCALDELVQAILKARLQHLVEIHFLERNCDKYVRQQKSLRNTDASYSSSG